MPDPVFEELPEIEQLRARNDELERLLQAQGNGSESDDIDARLRDLDSDRQRQSHATKVQEKASAQVHAILQSLGIDDLQRQELLAELGGIAAIVRLDEHDVPRIEVGGKSLPLAEGLAMHPAVRRRAAGAPVDPLSAAQQELEKVQSEIQEIKSIAQRRKPHEAELVRFNRLTRQARELQAKVANLTPAKQQGDVDPALLQERDEIDKRIQSHEQRYNPRSGSHHLAELAPLRRRKRQILREIDAQLRGAS